MDELLWWESDKLLANPFPRDTNAKTEKYFSFFILLLHSFINRRYQTYFRTISLNSLLEKPTKACYNILDKF